MTNLVSFKLFLFFLLMVSLAGITKALARPDPESQALRALCPIGQKAGGIWGNERINSAIATIRFGKIGQTALRLLLINSAITVAILNNCTNKLVIVPFK